MTAFRHLLLLALLGSGCAPAPLAERYCAFVDHPRNPLIRPPEGEALIADPTVLLPEDAPDQSWHLYAHSLTGIHHYRSSDGILWRHQPEVLFGVGALRPFLHRRQGTYYLYFEVSTDVLAGRSEIRVATSPDLVSWTEPVTLLRAELDWEKEAQSTVGNPYVLERDGEVWLYYSAAGVRLHDTNYYEPRYVGLARAPGPLGPFEKVAEPLLRPSADTPQRNLGAGSLKLLDGKVDGQWLALNNGIYLDGEGRTRSAILVLRSDDGLSWSPVCPEAPLAPSGEGWKSAFVYAFDTVTVQGELRVYYNAREGWTNPGIERIGMSSLKLR